MIPKVSVILSVYKPNLIDFERTIDSIVSQDFKDFELIVVKDDQEQSTLKALQSIHNVITNTSIIDNIKNIGLVKSLNKALKKAKGVYIARIDVGDWWHPQKLEAQYDAMVEDDLVLTGTQVKLFSTELDILKDQSMPLSDLEIRSCLENGKNPFVHSSVMFKKIHNVFYNENALYTEDFELWCRYYFFGSMSNLSQFYTNYIVDLNSITGNKRYLMFTNATTVYVNFIRYLYRKDKVSLILKGFIASPLKNMSFSERIFSKYYSMAYYEMLKGSRQRYLAFIILSFVCKPKVVYLFFKRKAIKLWYSYNL